MQLENELYKDKMALDIATTLSAMDNEINAYLTNGKIQKVEAWDDAEFING